MNTKNLFIFIFICAGVLGLAGYAQKHKDSTKAEKAEATGAENYIAFDMEVYDKILSTYWKKTTEAELADHFKLSAEKVLGTTTPLLTKDRAGTEQMIKYAFTFATTTESKKQLAVMITQVALFNLPPANRNQLLSQKQEKQLRETVANVNPQKDLYGDVGVSTGSSIEAVEKSSKQLQLSLKNATSSEDKARLDRIKYATKVLTNPDSKNLYDQAKVEPTLKYKKIGSTFYADLSQIAPTSLFELVKAIDNASTTKNLDTLVLDFRGNIGGSLDFLPAFFGLFVGNNQYVFDFFQKDEYKPQRTTQPKFPELDRFKEIAILTDNMTQSTAEITTATFKKFHMAKVVGKTTRGWGTIENTYPIDAVIDPEEKFVLLLVNSLTIRDDGQPIEGKGVDPDVDISKPNWQKELGKNFKSESIINAIKTVLK